MPLYLPSLHQVLLICKKERKDTLDLSGHAALGERKLEVCEGVGVGMK